MTTPAPTTVPPTTPAPTVDTVAWGHDTGVVEANIRDFFGNWVGDASIKGVNDAERIVFNPGEERISETWNIGFGRVKITIDKYQSGYGTPTIYYKTGASKVLCEADTWKAYTGSFVTAGWVKIKLKDFARLKLSTGDLLLLDDGTSHLVL